MARLTLVTAFCLIATMAWAQAAQAGAVITNGTVSLGVNDAGQLNFGGVGVQYVPTGGDGTFAGCPCEGWGAGNGAAADTFSGYANENFGGANNLDNVTFSSTPSTALSSATIDDKLKVTHDFRPFAGSPNLYEVSVTLENIGTTTLSDVRYTRLMDWDISPTEFNEFVTIQRGTTFSSGALKYSDDNGFVSGDPFDSRSPIFPGTENADFTDSGPGDHGALFDFAFGSLAAGAKKEFVIYYGATGTELAANAAVSAAGVELYSYGQPNTDGGPTLGTPNTFIFGFKAVGGAPIIPPTLTLTPASATNTVGEPHTVTAELKDSGGAPVPNAKIIFSVSGANPQAAETKTTGSDGKATYTYTGTTPGDDTIKACFDANENDACDTGEQSKTVSKTYVAATSGPSLSINDVSVIEGPAGSTVDAVFKVSLTCPSTSAVTVKFDTADGSATAPGDYLAKSTTVSYAAGECGDKDVPVTVNGDDIPEPDEDFFANLSAATNATIADDQGKGTILTDAICPPGTSDPAYCTEPGRVITLRKGVASVPVTCPRGAGGSCSGIVELRAASRARKSAKRRAAARLGARRYRRIGAGRTRMVRVKLSKKGLRTAKRKKRMRVNVLVRDRRARSVLRSGRIGTFTLRYRR